MRPGNLFERLRGGSMFASNWREFWFVISCIPWPTGDRVLHVGSFIRQIYNSV